VDNTSEENIKKCFVGLSEKGPDMCLVCFSFVDGYVDISKNRECYE